MSKIRILPSLIAERIAAGEVIERPASVVKELCENSIDAGATAIEVNLKRGGTDLIEIIDNGSGMAREDLEICIGRHATSKIREFDDLSRLDTLGFRGEALPSIASVSDLTIASRVKGAEETFEIRLSQGAAERVPANRIANFGFLGAPHGTRVRVASLFSQIPARLKFLKSPGAEASAVREILERLALTHPKVHFKLTHEERVTLDLPPEALRERAIRMLAGDNPFEVKEARLEGLYSIEVIWLKGLSLPHTPADRDPESAQAILPAGQLPGLCGPDRTSPGRARCERASLEDRDPLPRARENLCDLPCGVSAGSRGRTICAALPGVSSSRPEHSRRRSVFLFRRRLPRGFSRRFSGQLHPGALARDSLES
ncbi:MAG: hypothetical protein EBX52_00950 [Proteobacteria bacterium]|nr:hypothetical protein [Pseudomonadota bacterium]